LFRPQELPQLRQERRQTLFSLQQIASPTRPNIQRVVVLLCYRGFKLRDIVPVQVVVNSAKQSYYVLVVVSELNGCLAPLAGLWSRSIKTES
jgi:hypothetical protein